MPKIRFKLRLRCTKSRIGRRLASSVGTRAVGSAEAETIEQLGPCTLKGDKQRAHNGRRIMPKTRLRSSWGRKGRRLTNSEGKRAVGSAEAEGAENLGQYRPKDYMQRANDGRRIMPLPRLRCTWSGIG